MQLLSSSGSVRVNLAGQSRFQSVLSALSNSLMQRYSSTDLRDGCVSAEATFYDAFFKGPPAHPLRPYRSARLCISCEDDHAMVTYRLSGAHQVFMFLIAATVIGGFLFLIYGTLASAVTAAASIAVVSAINLAFQPERARRWLLAAVREAVEAAPNR